MKHHILITGCLGFIGSNLTESLLSDNYYVTGVDNCATGHFSNIEPFKSHPGFTFVKGDVSDKSFLQLHARSCHAIVHLAALKIPRYGGALNTLSVNVNGTWAVLEAAKALNIPAYIASTSDVYGKNDQLPFSENSSLVVGSPKIGRWSYAISKMFDEQLFYAYREEFGLKGAIFRFFGSYGPNQNRNWLGGPQAAFIQAILEHRKIEIHGDGLQTRSFCYVSDTVAGIRGVIESPRCDGEILNIGNDKEISILELAKLIWSISGNPGEAPIDFIPYSSFNRQYEDVRRRVPDLSLAASLIQYKPRVSLEDGLLKTYAWQKELHTSGHAAT